MATIDDLNAKNIRPRTIFRALLYDSNGTLLLTITEAELIRATVSLRSDLSRISPTLPESEIEIEAYFDTDISDVLAAAGEELEIRYRWWPNTSSYGTNRYFYTDERITWKNKILHIHAVDQVHKLDEELPPIYIGQDWYWNHSSISDHRVLYGFALAFRDFINGTRTANSGLLKNVSGQSITTWLNQDGTFGSVPDGGAVNIIQPRMTRREAIAKLMNLCHWDFESGALNSHTDFWPSYVDAGKPNYRFYKPTDAPLVINYEDCGDFQESKEPAISSLTATVSDVLWLGADQFDRVLDQNMKAQIVKQVGVTYEYNGFCDTYEIGIQDPDDNSMLLFYFGTWPYADDFSARKRPPVNATNTGTRDYMALYNNYGKWLLDDGVATNAWAPNPNSYTFLDLSGAKWTAPWDPDLSPDSPSSQWNYYETVELIPSGANSVDLQNNGVFFVSTNERTITKTTGGTGEGVVLDDIFVMGHAKMRRYDDSGTISLLPDKALDCIMDKSNVVGSFTWKGDPRMQPRDFVELKYPDENLADQDGVLLQNEDGDDIIVNRSKIITLENITLTHEGGGTVSEITYREGYC